MVNPGPQAVTEEGEMVCKTGPLFSMVTETVLLVEQLLPSVTVTPFPPEFAVAATEIKIELLLKSETTAPAGIPTPDMDSPIVIPLVLPARTANCLDPTFVWTCKV